MDLQEHPAAKAIRLMDESEYAALKNDIAQNGLIEPIVLYGGKILDGRNRYKACRELGIKPRFVNYEGSDPVSYVRSVNIKRRHLSKYELAVEALKEKPEIARRAKERQSVPKNSWERSEAEQKEIDAAWQEPGFSFDQRRNLVDDIKHRYAADRRRKAMRESQCLYLAVADEKFKIGLSVDPDSRIKQLQTSDPSISLRWFLPNGSKAIESKVLRRFRDHSIGGEWFRHSEKLVEQVRAYALREQRRASETSDQLASLAGVSHDTIAKVAGIEAKADKATKEAIIRGDLTINAAYAKINPHVSANTGQSEWFTPAEYIEAARAVMGEIDVDPASMREANAIIKAKIFYTIKNSGLDKKWRGRIWLNPPYSQPEVRRFCDVFADKFIAGEITEGCVLINNVTETAFGQRLLSLAAAACFPLGRVKFLDAQGKPGAPLQGQMVLYFGLKGKMFVTQFGKFGACLWNHAAK